MSWPIREPKPLENELEKTKPEKTKTSSKKIREVKNKFLP